jgi:hypothetical protein
MERDSYNLPSRASDAGPDENRCGVISDDPGIPGWNPPTRIELSHHTMRFVLEDPVSREHMADARYWAAFFRQVFEHDRRIEITGITIEEVN